MIRKYVMRSLLQYQKFVKNCAKRVVQKVDKPVPALPVDLFRVGAGLLSAAWFWRHYREIDTISSQDGFIDHQLVRRIFPYTQLSLLPLKVNDRVLQTMYLGAIGASLSIAAGVGQRTSAFYLYLTAVCTYRRNFVAMYVDDAIMHLLLFWLILFPTGDTLTLNLPKRRPWQTATVPGLIPRAFLANLSMIYLVAGVWKWNSPLWREGNALYAALKMPISNAPDFWPSNLQPLLKPASYAALLVEPFLSLIPLLPSGSRLKLGLSSILTAFHVGIIATLRVPYANIACLAALPLLLDDELMQLLAPSAQYDAPQLAQTPHYQTVAATTLLSLLVLANLWRIPEWQDVEGDKMRHHRNPWHSILWLGGIAQSYRLMDWIDQLNWHTYYEGEEEISAEIHPFDPDRLFPKTTRTVFLHSYIQARCWMIPPVHYLAELQTSLLTRYVKHFARTTPNTGKITIYTNTGHLVPGNFDLHEMRRFKLLQFQVRNGVPTIDHMHLCPLE